MPEDFHAPEGGGGFSLTKKVGPAPLWVWGLGGVAVLGFLYFRSKSSGGTPAVLPTATGAAGDANANGNPVGYDALSSQLVGLSGQIGSIGQQLQGQQGTTSTTGVTTPPNGAAGLYQSFLGRQGEAAGLGYWNNQIANGGLMSAFQQIETTPEAQQYAAQNPGAVVGQEYATFLGRNAAQDVAGQQYWTQYLQQHGAAAESAAFINAAKSEQATKP